MIDYAVTFLGALAGGVIVNLWGLWRGRRQVKGKTATCGCKHPRSMHVDGKGACQGTVKVVRDLMALDVACRCQIYDGPEPLPSYYAGEIEL